MNTQTIALDVSKATAVPPAIHIRQGDKNGTILNVGIFDNGTALNLTSLTVRMCAKLPDGVHYYSVNGTASGNTATFEIDESYAAAYPGITDLAYVDVLDGDDVICSTQPFRLVVEPGAREGVVPSEEHISEIDAAVERANEAAQECEELAYPITESQIDSIVSDTAVTSTNKLSATGLTYLWGKLKAAFASISHTHASASSTAAGFMSASEHDKLAGIESGAEVNDITGVKGDSESAYRTGNVNITAANVGAAAASHDHSGDALVPASVAATGAVSGSSISDGTGTLAQLRESVYPKGSYNVVVTFSTVKIGYYYHAIWPLPLGNNYTSVQQEVVSQVGSATSPISTSDVTVRLLSQNSADFYTGEDVAAGKSFLMTLTLQ